MITAGPLLSAGGVSVTIFRCDGAHTSWSREEVVESFSLMLVQRGSFRRRVDGSDGVAHPLLAYVEQPDSPHQFAHPAGGDVCTAIGLSESAVGALIDPDRVPAAALFPIEPCTDLAHRLLLMRLRESNQEVDELVESTLSIAADVLEGHATIPDRAHRRVIEGTHEALQVDPGLTVQALAAIFGLPAYQLSRIYRSATGCTLSRYRLRMRCHLAMDRIAAGESNLAGLAADLGFADQSHMTRCLHQELGVTPGRLEAMLR